MCNIILFETEINNDRYETLKNVMTMINTMISSLDKLHEDELELGIEVYLFTKWNLSSTYGDFEINNLIIDR